MNGMKILYTNKTTLGQSITQNYTIVYYMGSIIYEIHNMSPMFCIYSSLKSCIQPQKEVDNVNI